MKSHMYVFLCGHVTVLIPLIAAIHMNMLKALITKVKNSLWSPLQLTMGYNPLAEFTQGKLLSICHLYICTCYVYLSTNYVIQLFRLCDDITTIILIQK